MNNIEEGRLYKNEHRGMIRHYAETVVFLYLLWVGIYFIFDGIRSEGWEVLALKDYNLFKTLFFFSGVSFILFLFYGNLFYCSHGIITKNTVIGLNGYKIKRGELRFDEIEEIRLISKVWSVILVRDIKGKKLKLTTSIQPAEDFINEIIKRSINSKKIDLERLRVSYPNFIVYKKGLDKSK